jgi:type III secretion protein F
MNAKGESVTTMDLLQIQSDMAKWTLTTNIQSTLTKELGDALKGIIQKAG